MANTHKGEVSLEVGEDIYTLKMSINAICEIEDAAGLGIMQIAHALNDEELISIKLARTVFWGVLLEHHPDVTQKFAGELMDGVGMKVLMLKIKDVMDLAFLNEKGKDTKNPPKPGTEEDGTGSGS